MYGRCNITLTLYYITLDKIFGITFTKLSLLSKLSKLSRNLEHTLFTIFQINPIVPLLRKVKEAMSSTVRRVKIRLKFEGMLPKFIRDGDRGGRGGLDTLN